MDGIKEMLDRLPELNEGELSDLESKIIGEFETVEKQEPTAQVVDSMTALADALDAVRGEQQSRVAAQQELETRAAEAASRIRQAKPGEEEEPEEGGTPAEGEAPAEAVPGETPPEPPEGEVPETPPAEETEDEDEKKKKAAPSTFESTPTPENEPEPAENTPSAPDNEPTGPENEPTGETPSEVPAAPATVPGEVVSTSTEPAHTEEIPVAASATDVVVTPPTDNKPVPREERAQIAVTAGADIPGISAGTELSSQRDVANAFMKRLHNLQRVSSPSGQQYTVVTLTASFPEERTLKSGETEDNWDKIQQVVSPQAVVAAGACVPYEYRYDIWGTGVTDMPVKDSLPTFNADRGGIRWYKGPTLPTAPYEAGIGLWSVDGTVTDLDGGALTPANEKPCYPVTCPSPEDAVVQAVSMCLCFDNLTPRIWPELIAAHNDLALVQQARVIEQFLLNQIKAAGTAYTATGVLGAARDILGQVDAAAAALRYKHRLGPTQPLRVIFPSWLKDMVRADIAMQMPGDGLSDTLTLADSALDAWFRARRINITWSLEGPASAPVPTLANIANIADGFPDTIEWDMFIEGTFLVLDAGTLDLGVIRDSTHVANNTYCEFAESFYALTQVGGESVHFTSTISATGAAAALQNTATVL